MIYYGLSLIICAAPALFGVLHALRARVLAEFHDRLLISPLAPAVGRLQQAHLAAKDCPDCQMAVQRAVSRLQ
jgi:hypothetical protein